MINPLVPAFLLFLGVTVGAQHQPRVHGLPGRIAGTEQWIVHFKKRSFDLDEFRKAVRAGRPWSAVAPILEKYGVWMRADQAGFEASVRQFGGRVFMQYWIVNAAAIEIPHAKLSAVRELPNVLRLEPNLSSEPIIREATNGANHNSDAVNRLGFRGKGVATAIVDSGLDSSCGTKNRPHRTFFEDGDLTKRSRLLANVPVGSVPADNSLSHGTGVAGIAAGGAWGPVRADHGHAPHADIVGYSITDAPGGNTTAAVMAMSWQFVARDAAKYNIKTANNSYLGWPDPLHVTSQAMDSAARNADVLIVVAAGNSFGSTAHSQSCANGLAVGAVEPRAHRVAFFSSRGPLALDPQRTYPDLVACGVGTDMPLVDQESQIYTGSGTSMAAPQVCGAGTLLRSAVPSLLADQTKAILLASAQDVSLQNQSPPYNTRNAYGVGLLRDDTAMTTALDATAHGRARVLTASPVWQTSFAVKRGRVYRAAVTWMRQVMTSRNWSDLAIEILDGARSVVSADSPRNLYEVATFRALADGQLTLRVTGRWIEMGAQEFAWAVTEAATAADKAEFATFGSGCPGNPVGTGACVANNWVRSLDNSTTTARRVGIFMSTGSLSNLSGVSFYTRARTRPTQIRVSIAEFDFRTSQPSNQILASGTVMVGTAAGVYRAVMSTRLSFPFAQAICIVFDQADQLVLPVAPTGIRVPHFEDRSGWGRLVLTRNWQFQIECDRGRVTPKMTVSGFPTLGTRFQISLEDAPASRPVVFAFGRSDSMWGATPLPYTFAPPCQLLVYLDWLVFGASNGSGAASLSLQIPRGKDVLGMRFYNQCFAASSANGFGVISSNAGRGRIGEF